MLKFDPDLVEDEDVLPDWNEDDFSRELEEQLGAKGINMPSQPDGMIPDNPEDLTLLTSQDVGKLLTEFTSWLAYIKPQVAMAKGLSTVAKANLAASKKLKKPDEQIALLTVQSAHKEAYADVMEAMYSSIRTRRDNASREITRLGLDGPNPNYPSNDRNHR